MLEENYDFCCMLVTVILVVVNNVWSVCCGHMKLWNVFTNCRP